MQHVHPVVNNGYISRFHTGFFPGGGGGGGGGSVDARKSIPARVWTYLRTRIVGFSYNTIIHSNKYCVLIEYCSQS